MEVKSGYLLLETILSGDLAGFERRFNEILLTGARQLTRVIDDFRSEKFKVGGLGARDIQRIFPVIVTLRYFPMDKFISEYMESNLKRNGYLAQEFVQPLTIIPIKDLEKIEAIGGRFLELMKERLDDPVWKILPFGNFMFEKYYQPKGEFPANEFLLGRYRDLIAGSGKQIFNVDLANKE